MTHKEELRTHWQPEWVPAVCYVQGSRCPITSLPQDPEHWTCSELWDVRGAVQDFLPFSFCSPVMLVRPQLLLLGNGPAAHPAAQPKGPLTEDEGGFVQRCFSP